MKLNLNGVYFQVDVPLEVVHLTDEYWKNVVCIAPSSVLWIVLWILLAILPIGSCDTYQLHCSVNYLYCVFLESFSLSPSLAAFCLAVWMEFENHWSLFQVSYIIDEYRCGRTPNPDVLCNTRIKFGMD